MRPGSALSRAVAGAAAAALVVAGACPFREARASPPKIVLIGPGTAASVAERLKTELTALGFEVVEAAEPEQPGAGRELETVGRSLGAAAAVRLVPADGSAEVWIADRATGKTLVRERVAPQDAGMQSDLVVSVRTVELLRASLLELDVPPEPPVEPPPPPTRGEAVSDRAGAGNSAKRASQPVEPPVRGREVVGVELGTGLVASPGGLGPAPALLLGAHWMPSAVIGASVLAVLPPFTSTVEDKEGAAEVRASLASGGLRIVLGSVQSRWVNAWELGLAGEWLHVAGAANPPFRAHTTNLFTWGPYVRAGAGFALGTHARLRSDLLVGAAYPRPVVAFAGREVATWGRPCVVGSLGVEALLR